MGVSNCPAYAGLDTGWKNCPNHGVAYFWAVMFGLLMVAHIVQAIKWRKAYSAVIISSALLQMLVYSFRAVSINNPASHSWYTAWFVMILVGPLVTNAYVYMIMGRMVYNFHPERKLLRVEAGRFGLYFVILDIVAFFIQAGGAALASGDGSQVQTGIDVYMCGVAFQQLFILVFVYIAILFQRRVAKESTLEIRFRAFRLLYTLFAVLGLITVRIIFRLIEYSSGVQSNIPSHEVYMYIFDTTPMWIAILLLNIFHPGQYMPGKESDLPSYREKRRQKKEAKAAKDLSEDGQTYQMTPANEV